jgi:hypothetical protein
LPTFIKVYLFPSLPKIIAHLSTFLRKMNKWPQPTQVATYICTYCDNCLSVIERGWRRNGMIACVLWHWRNRRWPCDSQTGVSCSRCYCRVLPRASFRAYIHFITDQFCKPFTLFKWYTYGITDWSQKH